MNTTGERRQGPRSKDGQHDKGEAGTHCERSRETRSIDIEYGDANRCALVIVKIDDVGSSEDGRHCVVLLERPERGQRRRVRGPRHRKTNVVVWRPPSGQNAVDAVEFEVGCDLWAGRGDAGMLGHGSRATTKWSRWARDGNRARVSEDERCRLVIPEGREGGQRRRVRGWL
jgi:hypothetical protein